MDEVLSPNVTMIKRVVDYMPVYADGQTTATIHPNGVIVIDATQTKETIADLMEGFDFYEKRGHLYPVSVTGLKTGENDPVGSHRFCNMDDAIACSIEDIINTLGVPIWDKRGNDLNHYVGVSRYFRFMRYSKGGEHYPHYDSDFVFPNEPAHYTGYTAVVYFTDCNSGEICFVNDTRPNAEERLDWDRQATDDEITLRILPKKGRIVLFPHSLPHTVLPYTDDGYRIIARGDLVFCKNW